MRVMGGVAALILIGLFAGWIERRRLATGLVDRYLAQAGVSARYRITGLGPWTQRIEGVRLGDSRRPDLVARVVELRWSYGWRRPKLAAIAVDGVRMSATWRDGRLSLGAVDRLLPRSSTRGPVMPDFDLAARDASMTIDTPYGRIIAALAGSGNLARSFRGRVSVEGHKLEAAGCGVPHLAARWAVRTAAGAPTLHGPIAVAGLSCPARDLRIGLAQLRAEVTLSPTLDEGQGRLTVASVSGGTGRVHVQELGGDLSVQGTARDLRGAAMLTAAGIATPVARTANARLNASFRLRDGAQALAGDLRLRALAFRHDVVAAVADAGQGTAGTPLEPIAARVGGGLSSILASSDAAARFSLSNDGDTQRLHLDHARMRSRRGDMVDVDGQASMLSDRGWRIEGSVGGGTVPAIRLVATQAADRAPITATIGMSPYAAGGARLALEPVRVVAQGAAIRFATAATIDGPLASGRIEGLTLPIVGALDRSGGFHVGQGCSRIAFRRVALSGVELDPARLSLCGAPLVTRGRDGTIRVAAAIDGLALHGRTGTTPLTVQAAKFRLTGTKRLAGEGLAVRLGEDADPTRLTIGRLAGRFDAGGIGGNFVDLAGSIRNVPLLLSGAKGTWQVADGALRLDGQVGLSDRATAPRFRPLTSGNVALTLRNGRIHGTARLDEPRSAQAVATVTLTHDLTNGTGGARIDVPGITFVRGGLQPEMLTPLTLGVVANVSGTVTGQGRIDWSPAGVTSSGEFGTERIDLAAAFGPVTGLSTRIRFTDLLGLASAPHQEARIAEINPGVPVTNGVAHYQLLGNAKVGVEDAAWPFAAGTLSLDPTRLEFGQEAERRLTFRIDQLDAAAFVQQLDFPNIAATGTFGGVLPMIFDAQGGRIEQGWLRSRGGGTLAYVGELSNADIGMTGKLAFDALKAIRYSTLDIALDGRLDGEIVSRVRFEGVREPTGDQSLMARLIRNLPFRFNIQVRAPFRGLIGSARSYINPALLLQSGQPPAVQADDSRPVR